MGSSALAARQVVLTVALGHGLAPAARLLVLIFDAVILVVGLYTVLQSIVLVLFGDRILPLRCGAAVLVVVVDFGDCWVGVGEFAVPRRACELMPCRTALHVSI